MLIVLLVLWSSAITGYLLRNYPVPDIGKLITWTVWGMLFLIGVEVGSNPILFQSLDRLGLEALVLTILTSLGCAIPALFLWKRGALPAQPQHSPTPHTLSPGTSLWHQLKESGLIVLFFIGGCLAGSSPYLPQVPSDASFYVLCLLLTCVGFNIGQNNEMRRNLRKINKRLLYLPLVTISGTWAGAIVTSLILREYRPADWLAIGSGFGYYSLSSILITEARNAEMGTLALIYNILRELTALLGAPLLYRWFGPLAPISIGGATSGDTTLPVISRVCGSGFIPASIFHGLAVDFTVPFLVPFFCSL